MKRLLIFLLFLPVIAMAQESEVHDKSGELFRKLCKESKNPELRANYCYLAEQQKKAMEIYADIERAKG